MIENIRLSFQGLWTHKLRTTLTMLGIIIGIASMISIVASIEGTNEQIKRNLIGSGSNLVKVQLYQGDMVYDATYQGVPDDIHPVSSDKTELLKAIKDTEAITVYNRRTEYDSGIYYTDNYTNSFDVYGIQSDYFSTCNFLLKSGRSFVPKDYTDFRPVIIIDQTVANTLFPGENPIGKTVEYKSMAFVVIGIVEEAEKFEPVINTEEEYRQYLANLPSGKVFLPNTVWPEVFSYDEPEEVSLRAVSTDAMNSVGYAAVDIMNDGNSNANISYKANNILQNAQQLQQLEESSNQQLLWISAIVLLVGGIGVMNIMLVSVTERTREIGLKKALGAKKRQILRQFLTESVALTSTGGILGVLAGIALSKIFETVYEIPIYISLPTVAVAVVFSMLMGIIFGFIPSVKASNLNPIDALRHE